MINRESILTLLLIAFSGYVLYFVFLQLKQLLTGISFAQEYEKTGLAIVSFVNNKKTFNFVVDGGSTVSVIDKRYVKDLEVDGIGKYHLPFYSVGSDNNHSSEYVVPVFLTKNGYIKQQFCVYDLSSSLDWADEELGKPVHGLLGMDFLVANNYVLDYKRLRMYKK